MNLARKLTNKTKKRESITANGSIRRKPMAADFEGSSSPSPSNNNNGNSGLRAPSPSISLEQISQSNTSSGSVRLLPPTPTTGASLQSYGTGITPIPPLRTTEGSTGSTRQNNPQSPSQAQSSSNFMGRIFSSNNSNNEKERLHQQFQQADNAAVSSSQGVLNSQNSDSAGLSTFASSQLRRTLPEHNDAHNNLPPPAYSPDFRATAPTSPSTQLPPGSVIVTSAGPAMILPPAGFAAYGVSSQVGIPLPDDEGPAGSIHSSPEESRPESVPLPDDGPSDDEMTASAEFDDFSDFPDRPPRPLRPHPGSRGLPSNPRPDQNRNNQRNAQNMSMSGHTSSSTSHRQPTRSGTVPGGYEGSTMFENDDEEDFFEKATRAHKLHGKLSEKDKGPFADSDDSDEENSLRPARNTYGGEETGSVTIFRNSNRGGSGRGELPELPPGPRRPRVIYFYERHKDHYGFTNFSPHEVEYRNKKYPTSEHLFQAMKFIDHRPLLAEHIRTGGREPRFALNEARKFSPEVRGDWYQKNILIMEEVIELKFRQNSELKRELLGTGDAVLVENAGSNDDFWGNGADGNGQNHLGKALERLRTKFKLEKESGSGKKFKKWLIGNN